MRLRAGTFLVALPFFSLGCERAAEPPPETSTEAATTPASAPTAAAGALTVAPQHRPAGDIEFKAVLDLDQQPVGNEPQLRNGRIAVSREWLASLYVTFQTPDGTAACTAALIGPEVLLTAAHCVPSNGNVSFRFDDQVEPYATQCTQHPRYPADASADFALCRIQRPFEAPVGFFYETVDTQRMDDLVGARLLLTGYGCISDIVAQGETDGKYRIGFNAVDETSSSPEQRRGARYYAGSQENNLFTVDDANAANLCPGDSGGPAFRRRASDAPFTSRSIVGVNSRVFYKDQTFSSYGSSLVSATGGPDFRSWAESWTASEEVAACGLAGSIPNCRR